MTGLGTFRPCEKLTIGEGAVKCVRNSTKQSISLPVLLFFHHHNITLIPSTLPSSTTLLHSPQAPKDTIAILYIQCNKIKMLSFSFIALFALLFTIASGNIGSSLTCYTSDPFAPVPVPIYYGSQIGSYIGPATRCPRAKPTITITSTITSGQSVVSTSQGFTPVLSETYSATSTPNKDISSIVVSFDLGGRVTTVGEPLPTSLSCGSSDLSTITPTPSTCPSLATVTTSSTVTSPSSISYDACGTDNIVSFVNDPASDKQRASISSLTLYNVTAYTSFSDFDVFDCCAACQAVGCAYGRWTLSPLAACELYFQDDCYGKDWLGSTFNYDSSGSLSTDGNGGFTVFNGPCGQIVPHGPNS